MNSVQNTKIEEGILRILNQQNDLILKVGDNSTKLMMISTRSQNFEQMLETMTLSLEQTVTLFAQVKEGDSVDLKKVSALESEFVNLNSQFKAIVGGDVVTSDMLDSVKKDNLKLLKMIKSIKQKLDNSSVSFSTIIVNSLMLVIIMSAYHLIINA